MLLSYVHRETLPTTAAQDLFNQLDTDSSGAISLEELSEGLRRQVGFGRGHS